MKKTIALTLLLFIISVSFAQPDSSTTGRSRLWGEVWHYSPAICATGIDGKVIIQPEFNMGRTKMQIKEVGDGKDGQNELYHSIGVGYSFFLNDGLKHNVHCYYDLLNRLPFGFTFNLRMEYIYNISDNDHFIRPAAGITFYRLDIFYLHYFPLGKQLEGSGGSGAGIRYRCFNKKNYIERL